MKIRFKVIDWSRDIRTVDLKRSIEAAQATAAQRRADDVIERYWRERVRSNEVARIARSLVRTV